MEEATPSSVQRPPSDPPDDQRPIPNDHLPLFSILHSKLSSRLLENPNPCPGIDKGKGLPSILFVNPLPNRVKEKGRRLFYLSVPNPNPNPVREKGKRGKGHLESQCPKKASLPSSGGTNTPNIGSSPPFNQRGVAARSIWWDLEADSASYLVQQPTAIAERQFAECNDGRRWWWCSVCEDLKHRRPKQRSGIKAKSS
ncbi:hypothetical protein Cni_G20132 [Canna indica]|uniref:Uncharacterized protein n=1 Tax=Canna indica TaxID=4628 RepID=A0AAQ3QKF8_9LILI|nr:hypothetical protein Cni_G20132 [Canna indica]